MTLPGWLVQALGAVGTVCFTLMMLPQTVLNFQRRSTEGLSLGMMLMWHASGLLYAGFLLAQPGSSVWLIASMGSFSFLSCIIESQMVAFHPSVKRGQLAILLGGTVLLCAVSVLITIGLQWSMLIMSPAMEFVVGSLGPSVLVGAGFLPQIWVFLTTMSIEGYSFGVTAMDVIGSAANMAVLMSPAGMTWAQGFAAATPFLTIIAMHAVLVSVALGVCFVNRTSKKVAPEVDEGYRPIEA